MKRIMTWIKQALCKHDYKRIGNYYVYVNGHYIVPKTKFRCIKCGKVIYR